MSRAITAMPRFVRSVLHATDFSPASHGAFSHALAVALLRETRLTILHVGSGSNPQWTSFPAVRETMERWRMLAPDSHRSAVLDEFSVRVAKVSVPGHFPAAAIAKYLDQYPHDLLVLATAGREGVVRWLRSSGAARLARSCGTMTLFVPADAERYLVSPEGELSLDSVLVPVDYGRSARAAVELARRIAGSFGQKQVPIVLLHIGNEDEGPPFNLRDGETWTFQRAHRRAPHVDQVVAFATAIAANLIVMSTIGHASLLDAVRGSGMERLLRHAHCPVLAVPAHALAPTPSVRPLTSGPPGRGAGGRWPQSHEYVHVRMTRVTQRRTYSDAERFFS